ncbi:MAG TPA: hypothetical protein PLS49_03915, partial [Candidatus Woesebacteria bacterium]|nr:hypothetical protein [Candidatus Woesebacteria bacterium]
MKNNILIFLVIAIFIIPTPILAQRDPLENPQVPYMTDGLGNGVNPGSNKKSVIQEVVDVLFGGTVSSENSSLPSSNESINLPAPGNLLNPSPSYFPINSNSLLNNENLVYSEEIKNAVRICLNNRTIYEQAAAQKGIPWQILAGIHSKEGSCRANGSLVSGRAIGTAEPDIGVNCSSLAGGLGKPKVVPGGCGFDNLLDSAIYAGNHLKG